MNANDLASVLAVEQAQIAAGATACASSCDCHGGYICDRISAPGGHPGDNSPHVGRQSGGDLVQWGVGECPTAEEAAAAEAAAAADRQAATHGLLAQIDPALLVELLRAGGYL